MLQEEWNDMVTMPMGQNSWCTPEYYVWINEEEELTRPSREGITWLEDVMVALKIYHEILPYYLVTTSMHRQVVPRSIDHMLPPAEDDDRIVECIQIESSTEPKEYPEEESEFNDDEKEFEEDQEEDLEEDLEEDEDMGNDSGDDY